MEGTIRLNGGERLVNHAGWREVRGRGKSGGRGKGKRRRRRKRVVEYHRGG